MRALLIVNPAAGKRTAGPDDLDRSIAILDDAGFELERADTGTEAPTAADLAHRALAVGCTAVVVAGGDGTVQAVARVLAGTTVVLGVLPFGTYMNVAHGMGLPLAPLDAARVIAARRVRAFDTGVVHGRLFFEIAGVGVDAELVGAARHVEHGRWRAAFQRIWRYVTHGTHRVSLTVDGTAHAHRVMQILVLNGPYYAWAFPLLPKAVMDDGALDIAVFPRMGRIALIRGVVALARGEPLPQRPITYRGARIEMTSSARLAVHADGRVVGELPAVVECRRGALRVFA